MKTILKVLVGSRAHGLASETSDYDYKSIYILPTSEILSIHGAKKYKTVVNKENKDETIWELGHFLKLAIKSNPTVLEVFFSPVEMATEEAIELVSLFSSIWNSIDARNSYLGYARSQKRMLTQKKGNLKKVSVAYLRVLFQGYELLSTGRISVNTDNTEIGETLKNWKFSNFDVNEVLKECDIMENRLLEAFKANPDKKTNVKEVNNFLLKVRQNNWL